MKVLFFASYFPKPDNSLMGVWALSQAQALAQRPEVELIVVSFTSWVPQQLARSEGAKAYANCPDSYEWEGGVKVVYPRWLYYPINPVKGWMYKNPTPYLAIAAWSGKAKFKALVEEFQPDILFCHHSLPNAWIVSHWLKDLGIDLPLITSDYDFDEIADASTYAPRKAAMDYVTNDIDRMLCASNRMEQNLQAQFPQAKAKTLHQGITPLPEHLFQTPAPKLFQEKTIVLACALFAERKGVPVLVKAFAKIMDEFPDAQLRIIGSGPDEGNIRQAMADCQVGDRIELVGRKLHAEVLQEMVWAECFALVGWDEPFATVYIEAMAAGTPIICCNDGGINDVVEDGVQGFSVPPRDVTATAEALRKMLGDRQLRQAMGQNAFALIQNTLSWQHKSQELIDEFNALLSK